jgi:hypothetical protein
MPPEVSTAAAPIAAALPVGSTTPLGFDQVQPVKNGLTSDAAAVPIALSGAGPDESLDWAAASTLLFAEIGCQLQ